MGEQERVPRRDADTPPRGGADSRRPRIVTAAVISRDGKYLIAKRKGGGDLSGKWEFPGGKVEPGETEEHGLIRELAEELDVTAAVGEFICRTCFIHDGIDFELHAYRVTLTGGEPVAREHAQLRWVRPEEFGGYDFAESDRAIVAALREG
ncbi:MAG TPA: (deoxy)nucleoside triphosphate pyrophosphohydrolase [Spirochaetia bacterium]|nr:(deoxy)nucleoside triphosphate pyrophosphohydrolase [Spirochaetia bacterium]